MTTRFEKEHALEFLRVAMGRGSADFREGQWEAIDQLRYSLRLQSSLLD